MANRLHSFFTGGMFQDSLILVGGMGGTHFFNLLFQMVMGRTLASDEFALLVMFLGVFNVISLPLSVVSVSISRYVSLLVGKGQVGDVRRLIIHWGIRMGIISICLSTVCFLVPEKIAEFINLDRIAPIYIVGISLLGVFGRPVVLGALLGLQRFGCWCLCNILGAVARLLVGAALVLYISPYAGWGLLGNGIGFYGSMGLGLILLWSFLKKEPHSGGALPSMHGYVLSSFFILLGYSILMTVDVIIVKQRFPELAGDFAYAATLGRLVLLVPQALVGAMFPKVVGDGLGTRGQLHLFWKTMVATLFCAAGVALVFSLFARLFAQVVFDIPEPSADLVRWFRLLSWTMVPVALLNVPARYAMAQHRLRIAAIVPLAALCYIVISYRWAADPDILLYALAGISSIALVILSFSIGLGFHQPAGGIGGDVKK